MDHSHSDEYFLRQAIALAQEGSQLGKGGPFGALIVKNGEVLARAYNRVIADNDPTAHAEIVAIRAAAEQLENRHLKGCTLYTSCEPCPMCFSAAYFAKIDRVVFAASHPDAGKIAGFGMEDLYEELGKPPLARRPSHEQLLRQEGLRPFEIWVAKNKPN